MRGKILGEEIIEENKVITIRDPQVKQLSVKALAFALPKNFMVEQNYPNPFNPGTEINFSLPKSAEVVIEVYNLLDQVIKTLFSGRKEAGFHSVIWDGTDHYSRNAASGVYLYRVATETEQSVRKMILIR